MTHPLPPFSLCLNAPAGFWSQEYESPSPISMLRPASWMNMGRFTCLHLEVPLRLW